jgi:phage tail sheath protein FI
MPQSYTYPGVYVEEIPSGVRTIAGVSTSDTAFIDYFKQGPVDDPVRITSFGDFERIFGGLDARSAASYAIQQYYLNGGSIAYVVRVTERDAASGLSVATPASLILSDELQIDASSPGTWANDRIRVSLPPVPPGTPPDLFNLRLELLADTSAGAAVVATENFLSLSMDPANARYAPNVVAANSALGRVVHTSVLSPPIGVLSPPGDRLTGGTDGVAPGSDEWRTAAGAAAIQGAADVKTGIHALEKIAPFIFNILCLPGAVDLETADMEAVYKAALTFVEEKRAFLLIDVPENTAFDVMDTYLTDRGFTGKNAAIYFPRVRVPDALQGNTVREMAASGTIAGVYARTDAARGVWKAPAGTDAVMRNASVALKLNDAENGALNQLGVNVLRNFPIYTNLVWGTRTIDGADQNVSEWKYVPVRRVTLFIEESLYQGLKWVVFEPNDEPLWSQIRLNVGAFMNGLFRQGAFQGKTAREAYFVKCDRETPTQYDIDRGIVNIVVGFAPLKPAEFVVLKIQQIAGQLQV